MAPKPTRLNLGFKGCSDRAASASSPGAPDRRRCRRLRSLLHGSGAGRLLTAARSGAARPETGATTRLWRLAKQHVDGRPRGQPPVELERRRSGPLTLLVGQLQQAQLGLEVVSQRGFWIQGFGCSGERAEPTLRSGPKASPVYLYMRCPARANFCLCFLQGRT